MTTSTDNSPIVYDDPKQACLVQVVDFVQPWLTHPVAADYPALTRPLGLDVPVISWIIEEWEDAYRKRLITHMNDVHGVDLTKQINALPGNYLSVVLNNLGYNTRVMVDYVIPPRIDYEFLAAPYTLAPLWLGYHLIESYMLDIDMSTASNEDKYRYKQLQDINKAVSHAINQTLTDTPLPLQSKYVIVGTTKSTATRATIYVDRQNLATYLTANTIFKLCADWVSSKTNPQVRG